MRLFHVINFNKKRRLTALIFASLLMALILFIFPKETMMIFSNQNETVMSKGNKSEKKVALTFNISWGEERVYDILKTLKKSDTRATFFLSGEWAERHPQIVEAIEKDQHEIGMLGYRYKNYEEEDLEQIKKDMVYAKQIFEKMKIETTYIRPPVGIFSEDIIDLAESLNLEVIHWSVNSNDWQNPGVDKLSNDILNQTGKGDIILLHASDSALETAGALENIIPALQKKKLSLVTISEMTHDVTVKEKLIK